MLLTIVRTIAGFLGHRLCVRSTHSRYGVLFPVPWKDNIACYTKAQVNFCIELWLALWRFSYLMEKESARSRQNYAILLVEQTKVCLKNNKTGHMRRDEEKEHEISYWQ